MESERQPRFGHYVMFPCARTAGREEKLQAVETCLLRILKELRAPCPVPDFNTMEFIVHEGTHSEKSLNWYSDDTPDDAQEVMCVAVKFFGKERKP